MDWFREDIPVRRRLNFLMGFILRPRRYLAATPSETVRGGRRQKLFEDGNLRLKQPSPEGGRPGLSPETVFRYVVPGLPFGGGSDPGFIVGVYRSEGFLGSVVIAGDYRLKQFSARSFMPGFGG